MSKSPWKEILGWSRWALFFSGVATLSFCAFIFIDARIFQERENRALQQLIDQPPQYEGDSAGRASSPAAAEELIGRVDIARLGLSAIVMEGDDGGTLQRSAGHVPGTSLPGQPGNIGIAGHRDTFFRPLRNIQLDDVISLTTLRGQYRYRVISARVVSPSDVSVLDSTTGEILTLITCHPFDFIGPAPNRFVVRAQRIKG